MTSTEAYISKSLLSALDRNERQLDSHYAAMKEMKNPKLLRNLAPHWELVWWHRRSLVFLHSSSFSGWFGIQAPTSSCSTLVYWKMMLGCRIWVLFYQLPIVLPVTVPIIQREILSVVSAIYLTSLRISLSVRAKNINSHE